MSQYALVGSGGHARECIDAVRAAGDDVLCLLDEDAAKWGQRIMDVPVADRGLDAASDLPSDVQIVVAVGDNAARARIAAALTGRPFGTIIHPFSWIAPSAKVRPGAMIFAGTVVQTEAIIGHHAIINTGATLSHDCIAGDFSHIAVGAHLSGNVTVGTGAMMGAGTSARPGSMIGNWAIVGAGAVVVTDIPDGVTAMGGGKAIPVASG